MSGLKDLIKQGSVHERRIDMKTFPLEDGRVIVEGSLRDERMVLGYNWDGTERQPGQVHHMIVRLLVGGYPPTIMDAEAEMPGVPQELCPETAETVRKIIGMPITSGYSEEVRARIGGVAGCTHLTHLIVVLGPAAIHGYWTQSMRQPRPVPKSLDEFAGLSYLVNTCRLWREGGPILEEIEKRMAEIRSETAKVDKKE
jgi:hypothetical protein